jgi:hypothetical protein
MQHITACHTQTCLAACIITRRFNLSNRIKHGLFDALHKITHIGRKYKTPAQNRKLAVAGRFGSFKKVPVWLWYLNFH